MSAFDSEIIGKLREWERNFPSGLRPSNEWATSILKAGTDEDGLPLIFYVPRNVEALKFVHENGVDLLQRDPDGQTILWEASYYDIPSFTWIASLFRSHNAIDVPDNEGMTALSGHIKLGHLSNARILLEQGASVDTFATIARYGGTRLDIPTQALYASGTPLGIDQEDAAIAALKLLSEYGLKVSSESKSNLLKRAEEKMKLSTWISSNL